MDVTTIWQQVKDIADVVKSHADSIAIAGLVITVAAKNLMDGKKDIDALSDRLDNMNASVRPSFSSPAQKAIVPPR